ncbi:peptidoglycan editing factor PgeF [Undibacterium sp.]|uniref:peptidoglycan editing factor PgeF n=1 Tax=Undibacterium sp. TaxID=1914977 RepID=UPI002730AD27|nr:peptidoglycan editing factor PgeF [Undibacterium sp.]MDP1977894.1 peptidoglycan editing factor PgeF [Undibacterium sp.]
MKSDSKVLTALAPFPVVLPNWQHAPAAVRAFTTTRHGGFSNGPYGEAAGSAGLNLGDHVNDNPVAVKHNRDKLNLLLPSDVIFLSQVHGNIILDAADLAAGNIGDAVLSTQVGQVCAVLTADCLPVLFTDVSGKVVAAAHAGWRGLASGVLQNTVTAMRAKGAQEIIAWLGPAIGPQEFEVGRDVLDVFAAQVPDVQAYFEAEASQDGSEKYLADLYGLARKLLNDVGLSQVAGGDRCTVTEVAEFYSYRRDRVTGRMASLIWIAPN